MVGVVLAAGAGRRAGGPKALRRDESGVSWIERAVRRSEAAGCGRVLVVLGAEAARARLLVPSGASVVVADDWERGLSASLRAGLRAADGAAEDAAALVSLVDLPDEPVGVGARLLDGAPPTREVLARAVFEGRPGHPVLLGRDHWAELIARVHGDSGARDLLSGADVRRIECGDLWSGLDRDGPG
ncbi:molybdenum cofactor cytidylyltransferase [Rathayibacter tanaceti]|uniref:Molybdenum cofactor cytidylyltransferase n=1 Tax=Rathayibacter tanaceti TaxID=1671680 RepID=A0ACD2XN66_9MICO|nr:molybdenum cofactor cytidylyltransferase [Rathayibacter tanaceti]